MVRQPAVKIVPLVQTVRWHSVEIALEAQASGAIFFLVCNAGLLVKLIL
jgi:hypothetical protein